jgi:Na+-translocating ferredoxin:NAD+ oxidoreductase RnfE subunit
MNVFTQVNPRNTADLTDSIFQITRPLSQLNRIQSVLGHFVPQEIRLPAYIFIAVP